MSRKAVSSCAERKQCRVDAFRMLHATAPAPGTNAILITHKPNIVDALGKESLDVMEGAKPRSFVLKNDSCKVVPCIQMDERPHIAVVAK